ncbi:DUF6233 domain-containing protein [Streptomyces sp. NPDC001020]
MTSMRLVGFDSGSSSGRSTPAASARTISSVNAPCAVEVPIRMVGLTSDLSPAERLAKHRAVEQWLVWQLRQTRREIGKIEQQMRAPGYVVEKTLRKGHPLGATVHVAGCTMAQRETRRLSADDARAALTKDRRFFSACQFCAPARALALGTERE